MDQDQADPVEVTAAAVRGLMARRKVTGRQLARQLDWAPSYLQRRTAGAVAFSMKDLRAVADALECELADLIEM